MTIRDLLPSRRKPNGPSRALDRNLDRNSLDAFQREMNSLFDEFFNSFGANLPRQVGRRLPFAPWGEGMQNSFVPEVDVAETDKEVTVTADLPGMDEKDVKVELENNRLVLKGEKREEHEDKKGEWRQVETRYGSFQRVMDLPAEVEADKAKAKFKKGRLKITLPKKGGEHQNRKTIAIGSE